MFFVHGSVLDNALRVELRLFFFNVCFCPSSPTGKDFNEIWFRRSTHKNRVLGRTFGPKRDEVTGEWRKLHNEELNDLYCSPNIVRVIKLR